MKLLQITVEALALALLIIDFVRDWRARYSYRRR